jgi:GNAT superfamily N-acetyltransferase
MSLNSPTITEMLAPPFQIGYLADHQSFIPELARLHYAEWSALRPEESLEGRRERLRASCGRRSIPTGVVAFEGGTLLGSAMLTAHDMDTRMDLSPWLAGVFVVSEHRRKGIGSALVARIVEESRALGVTRLYLYTPKAERLYARLGWTLLERANYRAMEVAIMTLELTR